MQIPGEHDGVLANDPATAVDVVQHATNEHAVTELPDLARDQRAGATLAREADSRLHGERPRTRAGPRVTHPERIDHCDAIPAPQRFVEQRPALVPSSKGDGVCPRWRKGSTR